MGTTGGEIWPSRNKRFSTPLEPARLWLEPPSISSSFVRSCRRRPTDLSLFLRATSAEEPHDSLPVFPLFPLSPTFSRPNATFIHSRTRRARARGRGGCRVAALALSLPLSLCRPSSILHPGCVLARAGGSIYSVGVPVTDTPTAPAATAAQLVAGEGGKEEAA